MNKKILSYFALGSFSIALCFITGEILTRVMYHPQESIMFKENRRTGALKDRFDPLLGWTHVPNAVIPHHMPGYTVDYVINPKGLRGKDYPYAKSPGRRRVVVIGDSFTFGHGVEESARYSDQLEKKLENSEIVNMGVSGYSTAQQYLFLKTEG